MNSIKLYKWILFILMILILLLGAYIVSKKDLVKQIKVIIIWYFIILELNLINIYAVLSFYESNKNRKGPKGFKGIVGPRGFKGTSIMCQTCGLAGSDKGRFATTLGINHEKIKPGLCIFPYIQDYIYKNEPEKINPPPFGIKMPKSHTQGWCATSVNNQFEPQTIGFYDQNLTSQIDSETELNRLKNEYQQANYGILDIKIVYGNTLNEAKNIFSASYGRNASYEFIESDLNSGTGGKFIYLVVKRGTGSKGVKEIKFHYQRICPTAPPVKENFEIVNSLNDFVNLNMDSGGFSTRDTPCLYMYVKKGGAPFVKDIKIVKEGGEYPPGYTPITYEPDQLPDIEEDRNDFRAINNQYLDLNRGTHFVTNFDKLFFFVQEFQNIINIDTAFVYNDGALYVFMAENFYKFSQNAIDKSLSVIDGYPKSLQQKWGRLPTLKKQDEFAVVADDCSKYNGESVKCKNTLNCFYDSISNKCEPARVYDAAYTDLDGDTFFFKGQFIYKYNSKEMKIQNGYPKLISQVIKGAPSNIDAIFVWGKDYHTYIIKGNMHYKINQITKTIDRGYPKKNSLRWEGMPPVINAIFTLPFFVTRNESNSTREIKGNNHTYVISNEKVFYIDPNTDVVEEAGHVGDIFKGMIKLATDKTEFNFKKFTFPSFTFPSL